MSQGKYIGWDLYFPNESEPSTSMVSNPSVNHVLVSGEGMDPSISSIDYRCSIIDELILALRTTSEFLLRECGLMDSKGDIPSFYHEDDHMIALFDWQKIFKMNRFPSKTIQSAIEQDPRAEAVLRCIGLALYNCIPRSMAETAYLKRRRILVRICNYDFITPLKSLKSNLIGKFISFKGTVVRVGIVKPLVVRMKFQCQKCHVFLSLPFIDGNYDVPSQCIHSSCKSKSFEPLRDTAQTIDWQKIRIQEIVNDATREEGRIPRTVDVELSDDLVDSCIPGDIVNVSGVVKFTSTDVDGGRAFGQSKLKKCLYVLYVDANYITGSRSATKSDQSISFTHKELTGIKNIALVKNVFQLIVNSIAPKICGHETIKLGLALALFGGVRRYLSNENKLPIRGDPHVLIVGDPGLGKSQMLQSVATISPRGVYVCGNTTSTAGLTVTLVKEPGTGDFALEAGALVLADQGTCCIDEFDKMSTEHQALLEAMEQQSISIAKGGIVCNLSARATVIAAANPVGGHYNKSKTVCENLRIAAPVLSRFDLIFIILDKPDHMHDSLLSEHVMRLHSMKQVVSKGLHNGGKSFDHIYHNKNKNNNENIYNVNEQQEQDPDDFENDLNDFRLLCDRLRIDRQSFTPLPPHILRRYISYARKYVFPRLSSSAGLALQTFYLELRQKHKAVDSTPITTRQLEALVRLAEARAKLELREEVTEQDALDVIELMRDSLLDTYSDDVGVIDCGRSRGMSKSKQVSIFTNELSKVAIVKRNAIFSTDDLIDIATRLGMNTGCAFDDFINNMNQHGFLLKKGSRLWQLSSTSF